MRLPYLCKLPESFAQARWNERGASSGLRAGGGNDEISGVTVTMDGVGFVSAGKVRGGNFSNPSL